MEDMEMQTTNEGHDTTAKQGTRAQRSAHTSSTKGGPPQQRSKHQPKTVRTPPSRGSEAPQQRPRAEDELPSMETDETSAQRTASSAVHRSFADRLAAGTGEPGSQAAVAEVGVLLVVARLSSVELYHSFLVDSYGVSCLLRLQRKWETEHGLVRFLVPRRSCASS